MSYDNQGYPSSNQSAGSQGTSENPFADAAPQDSSQHSYPDQAENDFEATTHRASVFGSPSTGSGNTDAQQNYSGQDDTRLSMPAASHPASQSSAGYATPGSAGFPASHGSAATGYESQAAWGAPQQASDQAWGQQQAPDQSWGDPHAADQGWGHQPQATDQGWGNQPQAPDQGWGNAHQAPDQAWADQQQAPHQEWNAPQPKPRAEDNVVSAMTDFSFTRMATPGLVKILYIAAGVLGLLQLLGFTFSAFTLGGQIGTLGVVLGFMGLVGGLVGLLVFILAVRIFLELALSVVKTSQDVQHIRSKLDETG